MLRIAASVIPRPLCLFALCALAISMTACQGADSKKGKGEQSEQPSESPGASKSKGSKEGSQKSGDASSPGSEKGDPSENSKEKDDWFKEPGVCGEGCNILDPKSCGDDERCVSWNCALDPTPLQAWDDSNCRKVGKKQLLEECKRPWESSIANHCGQGMVCWSRCRETCRGDRDKPKCSNKKEACMLSNFGFVAACLPKCDPLDPKCEEEGSLCVPNGRLSNAFVCAPAGRKKAGTYGDPCKTVNQCAPGHYCVASRFVDHENCDSDFCCTEYCDLKDKEKGCSQEDAKCVSFFGDAAKAPKAYKQVGICSSL